MASESLPQHAAPAAGPRRSKKCLVATLIIGTICAFALVSGLAVKCGLDNPRIEDPEPATSGFETVTVTSPVFGVTTRRIVVSHKTTITGSAPSNTVKARRGVTATVVSSLSTHNGIAHSSESAKNLISTGYLTSALVTDTATSSSEPTTLPMADRIAERSVGTPQPKEPRAPSHDDGDDGDDYYDDSEDDDDLAYPNKSLGPLGDPTYLPCAPNPARCSAVMQRWPRMCAEYPTHCETLMAALLQYNWYINTGDEIPSCRDEPRACQGYLATQTDPDICSVPRVNATCDDLFRLGPKYVDATDAKMFRGFDYLPAGPTPLPPAGPAPVFPDEGNYWLPERPLHELAGEPRPPRAPRAAGTRAAAVDPLGAIIAPVARARRECLPSHPECLLCREFPSRCDTGIRALRVCCRSVDIRDRCWDVLMERLLAIEACDGPPVMNRNQCFDALFPDVNPGVPWTDCSNHPDLCQAFLNPTMVGTRVASELEDA